MNVPTMYRCRACGSLWREEEARDSATGLWRACGDAFCGGTVDPVAPIEETK